MHIGNGQLEDYMAGRMSKAGQEKLLEHISVCTSCAGRFAAAIQKQELVPPPPGLKRDILKKTVCKKEIQENLIYRLLSFRITREKKEYWLYSVRVVFAVVVAVIMILVPSDRFYSTDSRNKNIIVIEEKTTGRGTGHNSKILDLFRNTSERISDNVSKALKLDVDK